MKQRVFNIITALAMCASLFPAAVYAEEAVPENLEEPVIETEEEIFEEEPICEEETTPQDETQESVTEDISDSELEDIPDAEGPDDPAPELGKLFAVTYVDENGTEQIAHNVKSLADTLYTTTTLTSGWYVVWWDITVKERIEIKGDVNLILCDGYTLTTQRGIHNGGQNSLTIWGQDKQTGTLYSERPHEDYQAAIGGNDGEDGGRFEVHGGNVTVEATREDAAGIGGGRKGNGGTIRIYAGNVKVETGAAGGGAGIGGGLNGNGGVIEIYGGTVTSDGSWGMYCAAAGIGGGDSGDGGLIIIYGGNVTANGGGAHQKGAGAGIGGGDHGKGGRIEIHGGTVKATGGGMGFLGTSGAGIGGGDGADGGVITIYGGNVLASSPYSKAYFLYADQGAGIGGGDGGNGGEIYVYGGRAEGHGNEAFGRGDGGNDSGKLVLGDNIWAGECANIFPYNERYAKARIPEVYLIER